MGTINGKFGDNLSDKIQLALQGFFTGYSDINNKMYESDFNSDSGF